MKALNFLFVLFALFLWQCSTSQDPPIVDPDPSLLSIVDQSVNEGSSYTILSVQLKLDVASEKQITAFISARDGTAESSKDYIPFYNEPVIFAAGETERNYEITIAGDMIFEGDEYFEVTIESVTGPATIDDATARIDLLNDDVDKDQEIIVSPTIDWAALQALPSGSEPTYDVFNFGQPSNIPNAEFTSVGTVNDTIFFSPKINPSGDTLLYLGVFFEPGFEWPAYVTLISEPVSPGDSVELEVLMPILNNDISDTEFKYDLHIMIGTEQGRFGPYIIDPKIRIPSQ